MKILALEFSSRQRSVAVAEANPFRVLGGSMEGNPRVANGMVLVDRALSQAPITPAQIELLAIGLGPGSYAGIRSAIAIAQGWQLARDIRLVGISSVQVVVEEARQRGLRGTVSIIIDAQRQELYSADYAISPETTAETQPLRIISRTALPPGSTVVGPDAADIFPGGTNLYPNADILARLASTRTDYVSGEALQPIYLRESSFVKAPPPRFGTTQ
jgi:tRNA threonylcarbamoyladenosine biosynthesis protein TsaB